MGSIWLQVLPSVVAILGSGIALTAAVYTVRKNSRTIREVETLKAATGKEVEILKAELVRTSAQLDADRHYQLESRKRVYEDCEPLVMKLADSAEYAADRIVELGNARRWPEYQAIRDTRQFWMLAKTSEVISLSHSLLRPLALYTLFAESVTVVDLGFDPRLSEVYKLARAAYKVHLDDYKIAELSPRLAYDPVVHGWRDKRLSDPAVYWWQGLTRGRLDGAIELAVHRTEGRVTTYPEYERRYLEIYESPGDGRDKSLGLFCNPMYNFTPTDRPVFWRILMIQLLIYRRLTETCRFTVALPTAPDLNFRVADIADLQRNTPMSDEEFESALGAAQTYASNVLRESA